MNLFLSPHNDDETLFGAFTILRHRPIVVVVFYPDPRGGDPTTRLRETTLACRLLGAAGYKQGNVPQEPADTRKCSHEKLMEIQELLKLLDKQQSPERVWAPALSPNGNAEHAAVGQQAAAVFGDRVTHYHTYHAGQKVAQQNKPVPYEPSWIRLKHLALACYGSQYEKAGRHFMEDLREWYA